MQTAQIRPGSSGSSKRIACISRGRSSPEGGETFIDSFTSLIKAFHDERIRFVIIGVWGANYYARSGGTLFTTHDRDLFLPLDPANLLNAWNVCEQRGLSLRVGPEPLDRPRDLHLARRVIDHRAMTTAMDDEGLQIDLTLVMSGFEFEPVWTRRRTFKVDGVEIPVARLTDIVTSKARADRPKDRLFLAAYEETLRQLDPGDARS